MKRLFFINLLAITIGFSMVSCKKEKDEVAPSKKEISTTGPGEIIPGGCALPAPSYLSAGYLDTMYYSVHFSWPGVSGAVGYSVYRAEVDAATYYSYPYFLDDTSFTKVGTCTEPYYTPDAPAPGMMYCYRFTSSCGDSESSFSATIDMYGSPLDSASMGPNPVDEFKTLAEGTGGKLYTCSQSSDIPLIMQEIITNHCRAGTDLVFLVDNTGSMGDDIESVKASLQQLISILPANTRIGAGYYRDNNVDVDWYGSTGLSTDFASVNNYIQGFSAEGGGDWPESVFDGIYNTVNGMSWRPAANKMIIVIGDAPPLTDASLTQHSKQNIIDLCTSSGVMVNLYPILTSYISAGPKRVGIGSSRIQMRTNN